MGIFAERGESEAYKRLLRKGETLLVTDLTLSQEDFERLLRKLADHFDGTIGYHIVDGDREILIIGDLQAARTAYDEHVDQEAGEIRAAIRQGSGSARPLSETSVLIEGTDPSDWDRTTSMGRHDPSGWGPI